MMPVFGLDESTVERFWSGVIPEPMSGCWLWEGAEYRNGYGGFTVKRRGRTKNFLVHRLSYQLANDVTLTDSKIVVRHTCDTRLCANPDHLLPGTQYDNIHDAIRRGRFRTGSANAAKTHCQHGHEFSPENTKVSKRGYRTCRTCHRDNMRARYRAAKAA